MLILAVVTLAVLLVVVGCDDKDQSYLTKHYDTPNNYDDEITLPPIQYNNVVPSASFSVDENNPTQVLINVSGLYNPVTEEPIIPEENVNFFVEEDGILQSFKITRVDISNVLQADVVFTVDNSGSMSTEADAVAEGIIAFAQQLEASGLDVRFGCVGYYGSVSGAINFTTAEELESYLNERNGSPRTGTSRTRDFAGPDSAALHIAASSFASGVGGENGVVGTFFADSMFNWRSGASRQFINFTDEPTQPGGIEQWGTAYMCEQLSGKVNIHTVFSQDTMCYASDWNNLVDERPWWMSECTGGTMVFVSTDASDLDLSSLPVVGVMSNSYLVEYESSDASGTHTIRIYVFDEGADGVIEFVDIEYGP